VRLLITILGALVVALAVGIFMQNHPGVFTLTLGNTTIQTSFAFFAAALLFLSVLGKLLREQGFKADVRGGTDAAAARLGS